MKKVLITLLLTTICLSQPQVVQRQIEIKPFSERKGILTVTPVASSSIPQGSSASGAKGTWTVSGTDLYIWVEDGVAVKFTGVYFGQARLRTMDGGLFKTMAGENFRTVENYAP